MPNKTFVWKDLSSWKNDIEELFPLETRKELIKNIRDQHMNFEGVNQIDLFKDIFSEYGDYSVLEDYFINKFPLTFSFVRVYHCCRPIETNSYYQKGICVLDIDEANLAFWELLYDNPSFSVVTESHYERAIVSMANSKRHGKVSFGLDDRFFLTRGKPYLLQGSAYFNGLASFLDRELNCHIMPELKKIGKPTIFEVNMPVSKISESDMWELARTSFSAWSYAIAHNKDEVGMVDFSFELDRDLEPEFILRDYHPSILDE